MRDEKVIPLELAVRKMTSFPAEAAALQGRGLVKEGFAADLVVVDMAKVKDLATYEEPRRYSPGSSARPGPAAGHRPGPHLCSRRAIFMTRLENSH